jgi:hypothetical protein
MDTTCQPVISGSGVRNPDGAQTRGFNGLLIAGTSSAATYLGECRSIACCRLGVATYLFTLVEPLALAGATGQYWGTEPYWAQRGE